MASLSRDKNGTSRIQFIDGAGERRAIRLGAVPVKVAETVLRRIEALVAHAIAGTAHEPDLSAWLASVPTILYRRLVRVGLAAPRAEDEAAEIVTIDALCTAFKDRAAVKPGTAAAYAQTLDSLRAFYGPTRPITEITTASADLWRKEIATATEGEGRRKKRRTTADGRLAPATVAKRVHVAKQVFGKAVAWGWLEKSPFAALRAGSQANPARAAYVSRETLEAVLDACPGVEWRLVFALPRLAGLRCPSEVGGLAWGDVDFANGRLTVRSPKTEHHGGGHAVRLVPIVPRLREILADAFDAAAPGERLVVPMAGRPGANLRTTAEKIIARASVEAWPRLFQNDAHFRDAIEGGSGSSNQSGAKSGAESGARAAHFQAQQPAAEGGKVSQPENAIAMNRGRNSLSSAAGENRRIGKVGSTGFEPVTSTV